MKKLLIFTMFIATFSVNTFASENIETRHILSFAEDWEFTNGFNIEWIRNPKKYNVWLKWESVDLPFHPDTNGAESGWITFRKEIPPALIHRAKNGQSLSVDFGLVSDVNIHYINDQKFMQMGKAKPYESALYMRSAFELPLQKFIKEDQKNYYYIAIYYRNYHPVNIFGPEIIAGNAKDIYLHSYTRDIVKAIFLGIYLFVGFYHLLLFLRRRRDQYNLYFGLFALFFGVLGIFYISNRDLIFGQHVYLRLYLQHFLLYLSVPFILLFTVRFFAQKFTIVGLVYAAIAILLWLVEVIGPYYFQDFTLKIFYLMAMPAFLFMLFIIARAAIQKNPSAYYIGGGVLLLVFSAVNDILRDLEIIPTPKLADFAFLSFVMGIAGILASRFVRIHNEVEELNINLEKKVRERTSELNESLERVEALKKSQDGDYFLTSLLTSPLSKLPEEQSSISSEFFIEEYKKFQFRKWSRDIGGDICIADRIQLAGREFTFFTNADAMGKSMQGAGGVIIYGSLIHAWLDRIKMNPKEADTLPERWLKNLFIELHKTFSTFDGSMLMSCIIGLVDEYNGNVFFINAEHPWLILYRDKKASFIETELKLHKLGTLGVENKITVNTFQMSPADALFLGSDGKDDIVFHSETGQENIVNEDENLFLEFIENANGNIPEIVKAIKEKAALKDDLSIMKITRRDESALSQNTQSEIENLNKRIIEAIETKSHDQAFELLDHTIRTKKLESLLLSDTVFESMIRHVFNKKDIERLMLYSEKYYEKNPLSDLAAYYYILSLKTTRKYRNAVDHAERVRLRNPMHQKNLIILSDLYRIIKNNARAKKILSEAEKIDPKNKNIIKLKKILNEV